MNRVAFIALLIYVLLLRLAAAADNPTIESSKANNEHSSQKAGVQDKVPRNTLGPGMQVSLAWPQIAFDETLWKAHEAHRMAMIQDVVQRKKLLHWKKSVLDEEFPLPRQKSEHDTYTSYCLTGNNGHGGRIELEVVFSAGRVVRYRVVKFQPHYEVVSQATDWVE